jgi:serine/threonine protein kinase
MSLQPGDVLRERYRIESHLGKGGMGTVFLAHDITLDIQVALKENLNINPESERQFHREARLLAGLRHPNLPRVTDHFILEDRQYLVMDYIEGVDLNERVAEQRPTVEEIVGWADAIADALNFLHTRRPPIIHRDIKPANLKLQKNGRVVLVDFGIAKVFDQSQTTTGARGLTPGFSPPEQYGGKRTDERSDQYALAATLYLLLTNKRPADSIQRSLGKESLIPIRQLRPDVPEHVEAAIERGLALDQDQRFPNIDSFRSALRGELALETIRSPSASITPPKSSRRGLWTIVGVGSGLIAIVALAYGLSGGFGGLLSGDGVATPTLRPTIESLEPTSAITSDDALVLTQEAQATTPLIPPTLTPAPEVALETPPTTVEAPAEPSPEPTVISEPVLGGARQLAFASNRTGRPQIYLIDLETLNDQQLTDATSGACQPAWSSDGNRLAYISPCDTNREEYSGSSIFLMDVDSEGKPGEVTQPIMTIGGGSYDPAWSRDSSRIAFTSWVTGRPQVFSVNPDGSDLRNLNDDLAYNWAPTWSNDGTQIAFLTGRGGQEEIWTVPAAGGEERRFSRSDGKDVARPDWSPDGSVIVFQKVVGNIPRLMAAPVVDGGKRELQVCQEGPLSLQPMGEPTWSPDGAWLAFETWFDGVNHDIAVMRASCSEYTEVLSDFGLNFDAAWRPMPNPEP